MSYRGKRSRERRGSCTVRLIGLFVVLAAAAWLFFPASPAPSVPVAAQTETVPVQPVEQQERQEQAVTQPLHTVTSSGLAVTLTELEQSAIYSGEMILVNNQTPYSFPEEQSLVSIYEVKNKDYFVRDTNVLLDGAAAEALNELLAAFRSQGGSKTINVVAGYRTKELQQHLFDQSAERNGIDHANRYVAQPGGSEHHTGYAVDFSVLLPNGDSLDYDGQGEYRWLNENCQHYGFVVRYAEDKEIYTGIADEPWHFRYLGIPHATAMTERGECLEEYWDYLHSFSFDGEHLTISCASGEYEVWYTEGTQVYLPDTADYTLSGDNMAGMLVTVKIS